MINEQQSLIRVNNDESGYFFLSYGDVNDNITDKVEVDLIAINPVDLRAMGELLIRAAEKHEKQTNN
jgi:hypothetical protein